MSIGGVDLNTLNPQEILDTQHNPPRHLDPQQGMMMGQDGQPRTIADLSAEGEGDHVDFHRFRSDDQPAPLSKKEQMKICNDIANNIAKHLTPFPTKCSIAKRIGAIFAAIFSLGLALISKNIREQIFHGLSLHKIDGSLIKKTMSDIQQPIIPDIKNIRWINKENFFNALVSNCEKRFGKLYIN